MQAPGGPEEDRSGGFEYGGWIVPFFDEMAGRVMDEWISRAGALVLGRKTYEIFAAYWPYVTGDNPIAKTFNRVPKYVASRTLQTVEWNNSSLIKGDVVDTIKKLKSESGGEIQVHGSGDLIQTLLKHQLIDQFRLWTFPIVLGKGWRLFASGAVPAKFALVETLTTSKGVVLQVLQPAGAVEVGSFGVDEPSPAEFERRKKIAG